MTYPFSLPNLPYSYDAFEPVIDTQTMQIHHTKHHQAYIDKLNAALESHQELHTHTIEQLLTDVSNLPAEIKTAIQNHGGGHHNHSLFWESLTPNGAPATQTLEGIIANSFGSMDELKKKMVEAGMGRFGSGWVWVIQTQDKNLEVISTPNQDSPLMQGQTPIIGIDVWEHAYYLKYQSKRQEYLENIWTMIDWVKIESRIQK